MTVKCVAYCALVAGLYLTILPSSLSAPRYNIEPQLLYDFTKDHNDFVRAFFGCPKGTLEVSDKTCNPRAGLLDLNRFAKTRKMAAKLFGLTLPDDTERK